MTRRDEVRAELVRQVDELQVWFAGHTSAHPGWADRERCEADLVERLRLLDEGEGE
jgi:hypothetical protein